MFEIVDAAGGVTFTARVTPRANRDAIEGEYNGALKVLLTAPPVDDRANEALRRLLAKRLGVSVSKVTILSGHKGRLKRLFVAGVRRMLVIKALSGSTKGRA